MSGMNIKVVFIVFLFMVPSLPPVHPVPGLMGKALQTSTLPEAESACYLFLKK